MVAKIVVYCDDSVCAISDRLVVLHKQPCGLATTNAAAENLYAERTVITFRPGARNKDGRAPQDIVKGRTLPSRG